MTPSLAHLSHQLIDQAGALHDVATRAERAESALADIVRLVEALPEVEAGSVMMVSVRARDVLAIREAVKEWRRKA